MMHATLEFNSFSECVECLPGRSTKHAYRKDEVEGVKARPPGCSPVSNLHPSTTHLARVYAMASAVRASFVQQSAFTVKVLAGCQTAAVCFRCHIMVLKVQLEVATGSSPHPCS
jgi:hypothetical protein